LGAHAVRAATSGLRGLALRVRRHARSPAPRDDPPQPAVASNGPVTAGPAVATPPPSAATAWHPWPAHERSPVQRSLAAAPRYAPMRFATHARRRCEPPRSLMRRGSDAADR